MKRSGRAGLLGLIGLCLVLAVPGCSVERPPRCSAAVDAIKAADQAYATAWLTNDPARVMATLTEDALIMPSSLPSIRGAGDIHAFWWPEDSPSTTVTEFDLVQHETGGDGALAFVRGSFMLRFQYDGNEFSGVGDYLSLMRCLPDGSWRISHRMWNDLPPPSQ